MPTRIIVMPSEEEIQERLLAVDPELEKFVPYLAKMAGQTMWTPDWMVLRVFRAIELYMEESGTVPERGALAHYAPEIVEALAGQNGFAERVKQILQEILEG